MLERKPVEGRILVYSTELKMIRLKGTDFIVRRAYESLDPQKAHEWEETDISVFNDK